MRFRQKPPNFNSPNVNRQVSDLDGLRIESRLRVIAVGFDIRWYGGKRPTTQTRIIARIETIGPQREISSFTLVLFFIPRVSGTKHETASSVNIDLPNRHNERI